jgi:hypothetical protein
MIRGNDISAYSRRLTGRIAKIPLGLYRRFDADVVLHPDLLTFRGCAALLQGSPDRRRFRQGLHFALARRGFRNYSFVLRRSPQREWMIG